MVSNPPSKSKNILGSLKLYARKLFPFKVNQRNYVYLNDVFFNFQERDFAKFDETGSDGLFRDSNFSLTLNDEFHFLGEPEVTIGFLTTYQHRSNLFAEFYFNPEETANYNGFAPYLLLYKRSLANAETWDNLRYEDNHSK